MRHESAPFCVSQAWQASPGAFSWQSYRGAKKRHKRSKNFSRLLHAAYLLTCHWLKQVAWPKSNLKEAGLSLLGGGAARGREGEDVQWMQWTWAASGSMGSDKRPETQRQRGRWHSFFAVRKTLFKWKLCNKIHIMYSLVHSLEFICT